MKPNTNKRLDAISKHWEHLAKYYGGDAAKRYRGNLKRAATAARETAALFEGFDYAARQDVADDIETLRKAAVLLSQLSDDFEVAQRRADRVKSNHIAEQKARHDAELKAKAVELFGEQPDPQAVFAMAIDLDEFCRTGVDQYAKSKRCDRGLLAGEFRASELRYEANQQRLAPCLAIIAENAINSAGRSHISTDQHETRWLHASWSDFLAWRQERLTVRAMLQPSTP